MEYREISFESYALSFPFMILSERGRRGDGPCQGFILTTVMSVCLSTAELKYMVVPGIIKLHTIPQTQVILIDSHYRKPEKATPQAANAAVNSVIMSCSVCFNLVFPSLSVCISSTILGFY